MANIAILTTGGTIDKVYFDALSEFQVGEPMVGAILDTALVPYPVRVQPLLRKDSLEITDADREAIRAAVLAAPENGIIITHGTDTMTQTAAALAGIEGKTIVLVGALSPARFASTDAPFNLGMAIATAQVAAPGVWIAMSGTVFAGDKVRKDRAAGAFVAD
jgi:L-asparaginase